jgi:hypothetical protein
MYSFSVFSVHILTFSILVLHFLLYEVRYQAQVFPAWAASPATLVSMAVLWTSQIDLLEGRLVRVLPKM